MIADALGGVVRALEQLTAAVSSLATSQASAGAGALGGGPGGAGAGTGASCGCGGGADAVAGAAGPGQLPPITQSSIAGAKGAPDAKGRADSKDKSGSKDKSDKQGKAEKAEKSDAPAKASSKGEQIVAEAKKYLGKPYVYGAAGPSSFDCSGLTSYVLKQFGIKIPRTASQQMNSSAGTKITSKADLQPGDLVFFNGGGHTGIYIGDGKYIHAPKPGDKVKISSLNDSWAKSTYEFGRRFA